MALSEPVDSTLIPKRFCCPVDVSITAKLALFWLMKMLMRCDVSGVWLNVGPSYLLCAQQGAQFVLEVEMATC